MPRKRNSTSSEPVSTGGVTPSRTRRRVSHSKHASVTPAEVPAAESSPAEETSTSVAGKSPVTESNFQAADSNLPVTETAAAAEKEYVPDPDEIARLAYSFWESRGYQGGSAEEDWHRAEQELRESRHLLSKA